MPRPSKLTPDIQNHIVAAIRAGNFAIQAARSAGIGETTYYRWMELGKSNDAEPQYRQFRESIKKAEADAEIASVALIRKAANEGTWQAAAWYLERKHWERWGRNDKVRQEVSGADGGPVRVTVEDARNEVLRLLGVDE